MKHQVRIVAKGFFGSPSPPALTFNATGADAAGARPRGKLKNLKALLGDGSALAGSTPGAGASIAPLMLDYRLVFSDALGQKSAWTFTGTDYLAERATAFRSGTALEHTNVTDVEYASVADFILQNTAWALRLYLYESDNQNAYFLLRWSGWQIVIRDGAAAIMRLAATWTQIAENAYFTALGDADISASDQENIDTLKAQLYADYTEFATSSESLYNRVLTLVVVPDAAGVCHVMLDGQSVAAAPHSDVLKTRQSGVLWPETALTIKSSAGGFFWQAGYPEFMPTGQWRLGQFKDGQWKSDFSALTYNLNKITPDGTVINCDREILSEVWSEIVVNFSTSDVRQTPFLYWASALIAPGERSADETPAFDSDDHLDVHGVGPVVDGDAQFEGDDAYTTRRTSLDVELRNVNGLFNLPGVYYHALENRLCDVYLNGSLYLKNTLVKNSGLTTLRAATPNQAPVQVMRGDTRLHLGLCDFWGIVDEMPLRADFIGDATRLGYYIKLILRSCGFRASELAGVSENAGRVLPAAAPGESPCVRPGAGVMVGDYLRSLLEKYGLGWTLQLNANGWQFGPRDTTIHAAFTTNVAAHNALTYPGRWHVLDPLDLGRDFLDFYNEFIVEGASDPVTGLPISRSGLIHESIKAGLGQLPKNFLGRPKPYPVVRDEGLRTKADVIYALRSVMALHGRLGRFVGFETYFHPSLKPGMRITIDALLCEIARISSASFARDRMNLVCREVL